MRAVLPSSTASASKVFGPNAPHAWHPAYVLAAPHATSARDNGPRARWNSLLIHSLYPGPLLRSTTQKVGDVLARLLGGFYDTAQRDGSVRLGGS